MTINLKQLRKAFDDAMLEDIISVHMYQQPLKITCGVCGKAMTVTTIVDRDLDMTITVTPCKCTKEHKV